MRACGLILRPYVLNRQGFVAKLSQRGLEFRAMKPRRRRGLNTYTWIGIDVKAVHLGWSVGGPISRRRNLQRRLKHSDDVSGVKIVGGRQGAFFWIRPIGRSRRQPEIIPGRHRSLVAGPVVRPLFSLKRRADDGGPTIPVGGWGKPGDQLRR